MSDAFSVKDFRAELERIMPRYKWLLPRAEQVPIRGTLVAIGTVSRGSNRISTLHVTREQVLGRAWYSVKSAGYGAKSPWSGSAGDVTLARALRALQTNYRRKSLTYFALADALERGRHAA